jgi:inorganic pyrophosphatase/exopolyphosphatase
MSILKIGGKHASKLFDELQEAKNDLIKLSSRDLLRKDHKRWIMDGLSVGISSVTWSIDKWKQRDLSEMRHDWIQVLENFIAEVHLHLILRIPWTLCAS